MNNPLRVFVSYARENQDSARRLYRDLLSSGVDAWLDCEKLLPGQRWEQEIERAIRQSDYFVLLLSPQAVEKRGYIQKEIRRALDVLAEVPESQVFLIPARLNECQPTHPQLRELQWVDLFPRWEPGLARILEVFAFARASLAPTVSADVQDTRSMLGTIWKGVDSDGDYLEFTFEDGGIVQYENPAGTYGTGAWKQEGAKVYVELNNKYAQYSGQRVGSMIRGITRNVAGREWTWELRAV